MKRTRLVCTWCFFTLAGGACTPKQAARPPVAYTLTPGRAWAMHVATPAVAGVTHLRLQLLGRTTQGELHLSVVAAVPQEASCFSPNGRPAPGPASLFPKGWHLTRSQLQQLEATGGKLDLTLPAFQWPRAGIFLVLESLPSQPSQQVLGIVSSPQLGGPARQYVVVGPDSIQLGDARQIPADSFPHLLSYLDLSASHPQVVYRRHTNEKSWQRMPDDKLRFGLETRTFGPSK